jgi:hypothetical protein
MLIIYNRSILRGELARFALPEWKEGTVTVGWLSVMVDLECLGYVKLRKSRTRNSECHQNADDVNVHLVNDINDI